jgi:hypothetical protein
MLPLRGFGGDDAGGSMADLHLKNNRWLARVALVLLTIPSVWFVRGDIGILLSETQFVELRILIRILMIALPLAGLLAISVTSSTQSYSRAIWATSLGLAICYIGLSLFKPEASTFPYRFPLLTMAVMYAALPNYLGRQLAPPAMMGIGLIALDGLPLRLPNADFTGNMIAFLVFNAVGILVVLRRSQLENDVERLWQEQAQARQSAEVALAELHTLRGIIPICTHCKRVRTQMGAWQQIEQYVRDHSEADFSHGVCPTCFPVHYGEAR